MQNSATEDASQIVPEGMCIVVACNDDAFLRNNLLASQMVREGVRVHVERGAASAAAAYNRGLDATTAPIVIFAHQDVYFPPGWDRLLGHTIANLERLDPDWALVAPYGISEKWQHVGDVWSTSLARRLGTYFPLPVRAQSFDELVIVMRRSAGLRFDEALPGFHLYGTDIVQAALVRGDSAYVAWLPVVHNDKFHAALGADFTASYRYAWRKWRRRLPLRTPVQWIRWHGLSLGWSRWLARRSVGKRRVAAGDAQTDPHLFSEGCGWEAEDWPERGAPASPEPPPRLRQRVREWVENLV